jgi:3'-phosphoadenosine 5'-phosphosulfate sulfotransferase (PAPS reductase)/FAD synthetase
MLNKLIQTSRMDIMQQIFISADPILVAFSGGKDSVAMVLFLLEMGIEKSRIHLHHHDVDGEGVPLFDWACTKSYCQKFAETLGLKIFFSYRKGGIYRAIYRNNEAKQDVYFQIEPGGPYQIAPSDKKRINTRLKFPGVSKSLITRWCSAEVKIDVLRTVVAHHPLYKTGKSFILTGERREEGVINKDGAASGRAAYEEIEVDDHYNTNKRFVISWRPIIDFTEVEIWALFQKYKIQPHPAYMLGWPRCSCQICIFNHPDIWAKIYKISPEKVDKIGKTEIDLNFTLYSKEKHLSNGSSRQRSRTNGSVLDRPGTGGIHSSNHYR